jgi:hypothetical protein
MMVLGYCLFVNYRGNGAVGVSEDHGKLHHRGAPLRHPLVRTTVTLVSTIVGN